MANERIVLCEACQSEGRILTSNGGPDDTDHGPCPHCEGTGSEVIETEPVELADYECENCLGMPEHGCYCKAVGAVGPGGPLSKEAPVSESILTAREYDDLQVWLRHGRIGTGRGYQEEVDRAKKIEAERRGVSLSQAQQQVDK